MIDSNILFSAIIKNSFTRRKIFEYSDKFFIPEFMFDEVLKHRKLLQQKSHMTEFELELLLYLLSQHLEIIPEKELLPFKKPAAKIVKEIDPDDDHFIACALARKGSILWSDDKALKKQNVVTVVNSQEIGDYLDEH